ncbi:MULTISPECIES: O-linked N-acetylglucosamine transferase family protein [unclassified Microcoleus]|uniref:O-linked N-acetylglucosamine transferase family protein n=1 Tax=unclassified Microcoleus TaxID=2642155 RepID=UPI002FD1945E
MISDNLLALAPDWQEKAEQLLLKENYAQAAMLYEQAIAEQPSQKSYYWHLGLILLLQEQEAEAQTTWLLAMAEGESEEIELWTAELLEVLEAEAERQRLELTNYQVAWAIRQHIREIHPGDINNLLHSVGLSMVRKTYRGEESDALGAIITLLKSEPPIAVDSDLLLQVWKSVLDFAPFHPSSFEFTEACLKYVKEPLPVIENLLLFAYDIAYSGKQFHLATRYVELALQLEAKHPEILRALAGFYQDIGNFSKGIETAKLCYSVMEQLVDKIFANHVLLRGLMLAGGHWEDAWSAFEAHKLMMGALIEEYPTNLDSTAAIRLMSSLFFFPYFEDLPQEAGRIRIQIGNLFQENVENYAKPVVEKCRQRSLPLLQGGNQKRRYKVGYLSYCLRSHSVGWLARSLFEHHDRERFEICAYLLGSKLTNDPMQQWYISKSDKAFKLGISGIEAAEKIYEDEIDILIDLDSITMNTSCEVMAIKPAPVQVSWLGWDASGVPNVDYYIADNYVLPESAQDYYAEKIWRLPETYVAVDGFEVGVPTVRRDSLDIPSDAVIYYCSQMGYKYNPNTARLQMQIIKAVPNSYFVTKWFAEQESLKNFFIQIAESEGVSADSLRFLPPSASEAVHRANLGIADVVLDTYPYNGATTTLETLWMCIPLVTRVGEQFSARNSYGMMMNAGITEGISWTDEEYLEWGIRLGKDPVLRQKISWKLRQSRQTAPLWNGKQFTREMEKAYEQMWQRYVENYQQ